MSNELSVRVPMLQAVAESLPVFHAVCVPMATAVSPVVSGTFRCEEGTVLEGLLRLGEVSGGREGFAVAVLVQAQAESQVKMRSRVQKGRVGRQIVEHLKVMHADGEIEIVWRDGAREECMREVERITFKGTTFREMETALTSNVKASTAAYARETVRRHFREGGLVPQGCSTWCHPKLAALKVLVHSDRELRRRDVMYSKQIANNTLQMERARAQQARLAEERGATLESP